MSKRAEAKARAEANRVAKAALALVQGQNKNEGGEVNMENQNVASEVNGALESVALIGATAEETVENVETGEGGNEGASDDASGVETGDTAEQTGGNTADGTTAEVVEKTVSISFRKTHPKRLINALASINNAKIEENEDSFVIVAPYLKITRSDVETSIGKISDAKWRMMFVNRAGEVKEFNNYEFAIGTPKVVESATESKTETVQLNIRIDKHVKEELEKFRSPEFLDLNQNAFVEEALREFIANIRKELI